MSKPGRRRRTPAERLAARLERVAREDARRGESERSFLGKVLGGVPYFTSRPYITARPKKAR